MRKFTDLHSAVKLTIWFAVLLFAGRLWVSADSSARANPDKPVSAQITLQALTDAWISEGHPNSACGKEAYLSAGYDNLHYPPGKTVRSLLKFDLSGLPEGATVTQANLKMYYIDFAGPTTGIYTLSIAQVAGPWAENSLQWSIAPTITLGTPITATVDHEIKNTWISFNVTDLVQGWVQGDYPNYGLALIGPDDQSFEKATVEFFESSDGYDTAHPETILHSPHLEVTYQLASTPIFPPVPPLLPAAYLPLLMNNFPPVLDLHPIDNDGGEGNYTITWTPHPKGAAFYELFEWTGSAWEVVLTAYSEETAFNVTNKPLGTYSYYLKATGAWGTEQSLVRSVTVSDQPNPFVYLVISVGDYQNMPSVYTQDARLGNDLKYPVFDATDVQDMLEVYGYVDGQPSERVLALKNSQATKAAIETAITDWIDARETISSTIFIYYAGHTLLSGNSPNPFLAPYDLAFAPSVQPLTWLPSTGISGSEINTWLSELASKSILFVFDSSQSAWWFSELKAPGREILASSDLLEARWEFDDLKNGAFSKFFTDAQIEAGPASAEFEVGGISLLDAYNYSRQLVRQYVYAHTFEFQNPKINPESNSSTIFVKTTPSTTCTPLK